MQSDKSFAFLDAQERTKLNALVEQLQKTSSTAGAPQSPPVLRTAASLKQLGLKYLVQLLEAHCGKVTFAQSKPLLRDILQTQLPLTLRQDLLNLALHEGRIYNLTQVHLLELLLFPDTKSLTINTVRSWYRGSFLHVLAEQGTGLEHFQCDDPNWTSSNNVNNGPHLAPELCQTLGRLTQLRTASLRYFADDNLLAVLGAHCPQLRLLDLTGSHAVTDLGLRRLSCWEDCKHLQFPMNQSKPASKNTRKLSMEACLSWMPKLVKGLRRRRRSWPTSKSHAPSLIENAQPVLSVESPDCLRSTNSITNRNEEEKPNSCAQTLRLVRITGTQVTQPGLSDLQQRMPKVHCS